VRILPRPHEKGEKPGGVKKKPKGGEKKKKKKKTKKKKKSKKKKVPHTITPPHNQKINLNTKRAPKKKKTIWILRSQYTRHLAGHQNQSTSHHNKDYFRKSIRLQLASYQPSPLQIAFLTEHHQTSR